MRNHTIILLLILPSNKYFLPSHPYRPKRSHEAKPWAIIEINQ